MFREQLGNLDKSMIGGVNGVTTNLLGDVTLTSSNPITRLIDELATGAKVGLSQSTKFTCISLHPLLSLVHALSEYVHAFSV
jgi:hypothetical protein